MYLSFWFFSSSLILCVLNVLQGERERGCVNIESVDASALEGDLFMWSPRRFRFVHTFLSSFTRFAGFLLLKEMKTGEGKKKKKQKQSGRIDQ